MTPGKHLLLYHREWLLGLLHRSCTTSSAKTLALLTLQDHWNKEVRHWCPTGIHSRNKLLLVTKSSLRRNYCWCYAWLAIQKLLPYAWSTVWVHLHTRRNRGSYSYCSHLWKLSLQPCPHFFLLSKNNIKRLANDHFTIHLCKISRCFLRSWKHHKSSAFSNYTKITRNLEWSNLCPI